MTMTDAVPIRASNGPVHVGLWAGPFEALVPIHRMFRHYSIIMFQFMKFCDYITNLKIREIRYNQEAKSNRIMKKLMATEIYFSNF